MILSIRELQDMANILRRDVAIDTTSAGSGHPTSCFSCSEIMSVLFFNEMSYDNKNPNNLNNDEFILSKGHAAPILYACLKRAGCIHDDLTTLRKLNSNLEGHPMPRGNANSWIKVATGSLGQGLSVGCGMALANKLQKNNSRIYVLMGDSEIAEGSNYEAMQFASKYELDNLIAIVDVNGLGQRGETMSGHKILSHRLRFESFGWDTYVIDGHDIKKIVKVLAKARRVKDKPSVILARTIKGKGVSFLEDKGGWHGKVIPEEQLIKALNEIPRSAMPLLSIKKPIDVEKEKEVQSKFDFTEYKIGVLISTREAYGNALANLARSNSKVIAIDSEVSNSTYSEKVKEKTPDQFIENYIMEQNMIGVALGLSKIGNYNVYASTFGAFLTRAHDQLRMASLSNADFTVCGSHAGVSIGEDGASQMALEDISMFRNLPNSTIFYPSDAVSCEKLTALCGKINGLKYIRTTRNKTPVIYKDSEKFSIGDFKVLKEGKNDKAVFVGSGITLDEALKSYENLKKKKVDVAVVDLYCVKPFDGKRFIEFVNKHGMKIVLAEDHYVEGGIGEMINSVISGTGIKMKHLAVREIPHSGNAEELLEKYGIDWKGYEKAYKELK
ncbi:transketolase [Candidatus Pacearchaeota archaeon CG10_big_fil_rev_8_21_14_0_10_32_14]|nr:MAG: transketolase [Candidatus Pacearchaeota archaeon CG10_big_fil_rev_8_21_14_0_10_32_14]